MAYVQSQSASTQALSLARAFDADVTVGNCVLVFARVADETKTLTIADNNNGVYHVVQGPEDSPTQNNRMYCWLSKPHDAGATTVTVTADSGTPHLSIIIAEFAGRGAEEDEDWDSETTSTTHDITNSVTATEGADVVVAVLAGAGLDGCTPGMSYTERLDSGNRYLQTREGVTAGTYASGTITSTTARPSMMMIVSLPVNPHVGFGAMTWGAEGSPTGYTTYDVTNTNDSGAGSLRDAVSSGNRYITFSVGGTITMGSDLSINVDYLTIAGETAPSPGITLDCTNTPDDGSDDYLFDIRGKNPNTHDIIIRYLRAEGDGGHPNSNSDFFGVDGTQNAGSGTNGEAECYNIVIDHCTATQASDGGCDLFRNVRNVTISNNWFRTISHSTLIGGDAAGGTERRNLTFHNNLWCGKIRQPKFSRDTSVVNHVNNITYGWGRDLAPPGTGAAGLDIEHVDADGEYPTNLNIEGNILHHVSGLTYGGEDNAITWDDTSTDTTGIYFNANTLPAGETNAVSNAGRNTISAYADVAIQDAETVATTVYMGVGTHHRTAAEQTDLDTIWNALGYAGTPAARARIRVVTPAVGISVGTSLPPRTWSPGELVDAAMLNRELRDWLVDINGREEAIRGYIAAWAHVTNAGTPTLDDGVNVTSLTDNDVGLTTVTFTTDLANATYAARAQIIDATDVRRAFCESFAAGSVQVRTELSNGVDSDENFCLILVSD